jgi:hypothetical protein
VNATIYFVLMRWWCRDTAVASIGMAIGAGIGIFMFGSIVAKALPLSPTPWWLLVLGQVVVAWYCMACQQTKIQSQPLSQRILDRAEVSIIPAILFAAASAICTPLAYWVVAKLGA